MEYVTVRGVEVPALGLGTARMDETECRNAVETALELGYQHVDTAQMYGTEGPVGDAIAASGVDRADIFVTTKIHRRNLAYDDVLDSFDDSLSRLGMDYVDLLLIHAPSGTVPLEETLSAMDELRDDGTVGYIGVSNFSVEQLKRSMALSDAPILTNQVEYHPYHQQGELLEFCIENDVMLTAYSPLDVGDLVGDETLTEVGERYGKTAAQVALRWLVQQPMVSTIPKASNRNHLEQNIDIFDFELDADEMEQLFDLHGGLLDKIRDKLGL